jgi:hypothetical protein
MNIGVSRMKLELSDGHKLIVRQVTEYAMFTTLQSFSTSSEKSAIPDEALNLHYIARNAINTIPDPKRDLERPGFYKM